MKKWNIPKENFDTGIEREEIWSIDAFGMTPEKVAMYFADTYFGEPRTVDVLTQDCIFTLVDGLRYYEIRYIKSDGKTVPDTYRIFA